MVKKIIERPPRIFVKKGKLYIRIGKKKYLIKNQEEYTKRELIDIILKELVVRRKRRIRGALTAREKKLDKSDMKTFEEFEKLNRGQSKYLKLPDGYVQKAKGEQTFFNALVRAFSTLPGDVNIESRKVVEEKKVVPAITPGPVKAITTGPSSVSSLLTSATPPASTKPPTPVSTPGSVSVVIPSAPPPPLEVEPPKKKVVLRKDVEDKLDKYIKKIKFRKKEGGGAYSMFRSLVPNEERENYKTKKIDVFKEFIYKTYENDYGLLSKDLDTGRFLTYLPLYSDPPDVEEFLRTTEEEKHTTEEEKRTPEEEEHEQATAQRELAQQALLDQTASGKFYRGKGLTTQEIDKMMEPFGDAYLGTFPSDFLKFIKIDKLPKKFGFVMNLDNSKKKGSHWVSVFIDLEDDLSIEYYDSFSREPSNMFLKQLKKLIDKLDVNVYLKMKINRIVEQNVKTSNCGWFAMKFLSSRFIGKPFREVTKYDDSVKGEENIDKLKTKFGYI